jgi:hypothetical protein
LWLLTAIEGNVAIFYSSYIRRQEHKKPHSKVNCKPSKGAVSKILIKDGEEETTAAIMDFMRGFFGVESTCSWAFHQGDTAPVVNQLKYLIVSVLQ